MDRRFILAASVFAAVSLACASRATAAITSFGSLSNFDCINDTGQECHGFEIDLEGVTAADVLYCFGDPYIRYGNPTVTDTATGVQIRYAATFDLGTHTWSAGTPMQDASSPVITGGHSLFYPAYGGDPTYPAAPGDHFGISLNGNPTATTYRWLWGDSSGALIDATTNVKLPVPVMTITPPASPAAPAAVNANVQAIPNTTGKEFGDAIWVKVFVTESESEVELNHLVAGDPAVPGRDAEGNIVETETEVEWVILQTGGTENELDSGDKDMAAGSKSVTRRYEFYEYIGGYDQETNEVLHDVPGTAESPELYVGAFIGSQNVALNLLGVDVPEPGSLALLAAGAPLLLRKRRARVH